MSPTLGEQAIAEFVCEAQIEQDYRHKTPHKEPPSVRPTGLDKLMRRAEKLAAKKLRRKHK